MAQREEIKPTMRADRHGLQVQFITWPGYALSTFRVQAVGLPLSGAWLTANSRALRFALRRRASKAVKHQSFVGTGCFDAAQDVCAPQHSLSRPGPVAASRESVQSTKSMIYTADLNTDYAVYDSRLNDGSHLLRGGCWSIGSFSLYGGCRQTVYRSGRFSSGPTGHCNARRPMAAKYDRSDG
jgi:hypothetical protein